MTSKGWNNAVERLSKRARQGGTSSGLSTALSLGFGALLLALALTGARPQPEATPEPPAPAEASQPEPSRPAQAPDAPSPRPPTPLAMARVELPPPPASMAAPKRAAQSTAPKSPPPEPESSRPSPPVSERTPTKPKPPPAAKPLPPAAVAARPALAPPEPEPAPEPPVARSSEPAEKMPAKAIKALEVERELAREPSPPRRVEPLREEPSKRAAPEPEPPALAATRESAPPAVAIRVGDTAAPEAVEGRVLLHILEHGSGPGIVIAWPRSARERSALYSLLAGCYGVRTALLDSAGRLYRADHAQAWTPNTDRYSGFLRQVEGQVPASERGAVAAIHRSHPSLGSSSTVRLFPRNVDAVLLGGLRGIVGDRYGEASRISASYARSGQRIVVKDVRVDGAALPGSVALTPPRYCPAAGRT